MMSFFSPPQRWSALVLAILVTWLPPQVMAQVAKPAASVTFSNTGQPRAWLLEPGAYEVKGHGQVRLGMTLAQVKAQLGKDHPQAMSTWQQVLDPITRTTGATITVPHMPPGPGAANLSYIFGASSQRLVAINVYWALPPTATAAQREPLAAAAAELTAGFMGWQWPPLSIARGLVSGPGTVVVFAARDDASAGVEVRLDGVDFDVIQPPAQPGQPEKLQRRTAPPGPAQLRLAFVANVAQPDVYRIPDGAF
jgi:hypothetical protein